MGPPATKFSTTEPWLPLKCTFFQKVFFKIFRKSFLCIYISHDDYTIINVPYQFRKEKKKKKILKKSFNCKKNFNYILSINSVIMLLFYLSLPPLKCIYNIQLNLDAKST